MPTVGASRLERGRFELRPRVGFEPLSAGLPVGQVDDISVAGRQFAVAAGPGDPADDMR